MSLKNINLLIKRIINPNFLTKEFKNTRQKVIKSDRRKSTKLILKSQFHSCTNLSNLTHLLSKVIENMVQ